MNRLLPLFVVLLLFGTIDADKTTDRSQLLFNYMTPLALGIACSCIVILIVATIVICVLDLRGQSGLPKQAKEGQSLMWKPVKIASEKTLKEPLLKNSEESETQKSPSMKMADLEAEATQFSLVRGYSARLDPQEKHNRIIEAIYQASGRDLPEMYRTKNKLALGKNENLETMVNPLEAINEDQEEDQAGIDFTQTDFTKVEPEAVKIQDLLADSAQLNTEKKEKHEEKAKSEKTKHGDSASEENDKGEDGKSDKSTKSETTTKTEKKEENKTSAEREEKKEEQKEEKKDGESKKQTEEKKTSKEETKKEEGEQKKEEEEKKKEDK